MNRTKEIRAFFNEIKVAYGKLRKNNGRLKSIGILLLVLMFVLFATRSINDLEPINDGGESA